MADALRDAADFEADWLTREAIGRALDGLPQELRVAVTLRHVHGREYRDIATTTGVPIGTVGSRRPPPPHEGGPPPGPPPR